MSSATDRPSRYLWDRRVRFGPGGTVFVGDRRVTSGGRIYSTRGGDLIGVYPTQDDAIFSLIGEPR